VSLDHLAFNLVDLLLLAVLGLGIAQGRKRGMTGELMSLLKWVAILIGCALLYQPLGQLIAALGVFTMVSSCLIAYLVVALLIWVGFSMADRRLRDRLVGSDRFGRAEYYLGMVSGALRIECMVLVGLALLNARSFSPAEIKAMDAYQDAAFGCHIFPTVHSLQVAVFENSLAGPWIKQDLGFLLVQEPEPQQLAQGK